MDTLEWTKIVGGLCGALLIFMLFGWGADALYSTHAESHGEDDGHGEKVAMAYPIEVDEAGGGEAKEEGPSFAEVLASADPAKGEKVFSKCKACHKLNGEDGTGPHLNGVVGRDIASVAGFGYSGALQGIEGDWTPENLDHFLEKPKGFAPGTIMGFAGLKKIQDRANIVAYLQTTQ